MSPKKKSTRPRPIGKSSAAIDAALVPLLAALDRLSPSQRLREVARIAPSLVALPPIDASVAHGDFLQRMLSLAIDDSGATSLVEHVEAVAHFAAAVQKREAGVRMAGELLRFRLGESVARELVVELIEASQRSRGKRSRGAPSFNQAIFEILQPFGAQSVEAIKKSRTRRKRWHSETD